MENSSSNLAASEKCRLCGQASNSLGQGPLLSLLYPSDYTLPIDMSPFQLSPPPARVFFHSWDSPEENDRNRTEKY
ncbi:hypothetical protein LOD99_13244 [Oopsacas minuta]|uniref:Uncharacterized protein n=1 Tax=Oopsacas minuta TaxID=111878 RepID=A0AAV7JB97_9METZ|nr:hypothetical protein LOD99_13244 [Oopsacas minuta]